ncbi:MAG TPA: glycoside hydrolase 43 family protein [Phycisphaerae bacterium]|nr:glycoside hydrolase 43 family protein [Phycisphaerae bacterium]
MMHTTLLIRVAMVALIISALAWNGSVALAQDAGAAKNPIIYADVPDMAMIRVGDTYYMSSTTMHFNPGVPIMKSKDLVNWEIVNYAYPTLGDGDNLTLTNGRSNYRQGSWASSLRYHNGIYYCTTFSLATGKTYIFTTKEIEKGPWKTSVLNKIYHDHSLVFDDDGRVYLIYGGGTIRIVELTADASAIKEGGVNQVLIQDASAPAGPDIMLHAEGSQLMRRDGKYYLFNICWPRNGMRTVVVHRADHLLGPYEGKVAFADKGIAQGSLIDTPDGKWYAYLFRDAGAVGRIPYLVPTEWKDGWPVIGIDGKSPEVLEGLPASRGLIPGIVASDEFDRKAGDRPLPLVWQWNHNPANDLWSVTARPGFLRLSTGRTDAGIFSARNTLTQRTIGPVCSGSTCIDTSGMKDGDFAGVVLLQKRYGMVGVKIDGNQRAIVMAGGENDSPSDVESVPLDRPIVYLKAECDFTNKADTARFYYSLDGQSWRAIGHDLKMVYSLAHFVGYRFGLFNYATKTPGGYADFDYFHISDQISPAAR